MTLGSLLIKQVEDIYRSLTTLIINSLAKGSLRDFSHQISEIQLCEEDSGGLTVLIPLTIIMLLVTVYR